MSVLIGVSIMYSTDRYLMSENNGKIPGVLNITDRYVEDTGETPTVLAPN